MASEYKKLFIVIFCLLICKISLANKLTKRDLTSCLADVQGKKVYPTDPEYKTNIIDENTRVNFTPSVIVYANIVADVEVSVYCASTLNISISVRSGGHSYEKYGSIGAITVDITNLNQTIINSTTNTAVIGAGSRIGPIFYALSQAGFFIPLGTCPSVGIGGHALGGGYGLFGRKYGLALDSILSIDLVNATGKLITVNADTYTDLFFALRGAGANNYGIVTSFTFKIYPAPPKVTSITLKYNLTNIQPVFDTISQLGPTLSDDISFTLVIDNGEASFEGVYLGPQADAQQAMSQFISLSQPTATTNQFIEETLFNSVVRWGFQGTNGTINPYHTPNNFKAKSFYVKSPGLSAQGIQSLLSFIKGLPTTCPTFAEFDLYAGGAANNVAANATAFVHRDALYTIQLYTTLNGDNTTNSQCLTRLNSFGEAFQSNYTDYTSYQNYIDHDLSDWLNRYYGSNLPALITAKKVYDPNNVFNYIQGIPMTYNATNSFQPISSSTVSPGSTSNNSTSNNSNIGAIIGETIACKISLASKLSKRDLTSCLADVQGKKVYPTDPEYKTNIIDENTRWQMFNCQYYEKYGSIGAITVDITNLNQTIINSTTNTAVIGAGSRIGPIFYALSQAGFFIPLGTCPSVGIGGHALGGGYRQFGRKYGLVLDSILSIDLVDATGRLITVNADTYTDLFFALRGAGNNNYEIVTSFTFKIYPAPPKVTSITLTYNLTNIQPVFDTISQLGPTLSDDISFSLVIDNGEASLEGVYLGPQADAQQAMSQFITLSQPTTTTNQFIEETLFDSVVRWGFQGANGTINPYHSPNDFKAKSFYVKSPGLSAQGIQLLLSFIKGLPITCPTFAGFDLYAGGAANKVAANATAFVHRDVLYVIQLYTTLKGDNTMNSQCIIQLNSFGEAFQSNYTDYTSYQNYIDHDLSDWLNRYYGSNLPALIAAKKVFIDAGETGETLGEWW
ncbi:2392_t:CDS:2 [Scutellospora calospora]|uniref:2392_t:CDS:1 n=1 Tax=Scutellospora calospora TaxID=85575 RepID=A0ACA9JZP1_9GLOM|nr:2392_t:CDS:2 [Scutellospora calospora]